MYYDFFFLQLNMNDETLTTELTIQKINVVTNLIVHFQNLTLGSQMPR